MNTKYLVILLFGGLAILGLVIVGPSLVTDETTETITENDVSTNHGQYYSEATFTSPPDSFGTAISKHNNQLLQSDSFTFTFERAINDTVQSSIMFERDGENSITTKEVPRPTESGETTMISITEYFDRPTVYTQIYDEKTQENQYSRSDGVSRTQRIRSGVAELQSLQTSFIEFEHQETATINDTTYYVYSVAVTDQSGLNSYQIGDSTSGETTASGQLIVSEYGVINKTTLELERTETDYRVSFHYQLSDVGSTTVEEPLWLSEFN